MRRWLSISGGPFLENLSDTVLRVDHDHWSQTQTDLRETVLSAAHPRSPERVLALYDSAQGESATQVAKRTGRHPQTVMGWLHTDNEHGPEALRYQRSGGRRKLAAVPVA